MNKKNFTLVCVLFILCGCASSLDKVSSLYRTTTARYERILARKDTLRTRLQLARFYYEFKDYARVAELLKDSQAKPARFLLAKTYAQLKEYTQALELFNQLGQEGGPEYVYLYGLTAQEKNLFPQALELYRKVKAPYQELAAARIKGIGVKIEEGLPEEIAQILKEEEEFLAQIDEEEAVTLFVDEIIEIKPDNTSCSTVYAAQKVLKEKGKDIGEVVISYDSTYERVELEYARTITAEGRIIYAGGENIRDVSKYLNFPLYSNAKAFIVSMPSVEVGSIVEYKARVYSSKLINDDDFTFIYRLQDYYPIVRERFKLIVPKESEVNFKILNQSYAEGRELLPQSQEEEDEKNNIYHLEFKYVGPIIPEENMPPAAKINSAILISSFGSWQEIYDWWYELFRDKTSLSRELEEFVAELTKDCESDLEKIKAIHTFCARDIRYVGVEYGESGHEPHQASDVFLNRYGDCKDQATLLVAMLREAGQKAYPVLIPTRGVYPVSYDFPSVNFNHAIAAVEHEGELVFMDPTSTTTAFFDLPLSDQERKVMVFLDQGYKLADTPLIKDNEVVFKMQVDIDGQERAVIKRDVITKGSFASAQRYFLKYTHPQKIKETLQQKMKSISPLTTLIDYKIEDVDDYNKSPLLQYRFEARKFLNPAKNLRIIPPLSDVGVDVSYAGKDERNFPIEFVGLSRQASEVSINLPDNLKVKHFPQARSLATPWFDFKASYRQDGNSLDFSHEFVIKKRWVSRQDYQEFKNNLEEVFYLLREEIILEKQ